MCDPPIVAVRLTAATLSWLAMEILEPEQAPFWQRVTHIIFEGLGVCADGNVTSMESTVLGSPEVYVGLVEHICRCNPHISLVWAMHLHDEQPETLRCIQLNRPRFHQTLQAFVARYDIARLMLDYHTLRAAACCTADWALLADIPVQWWVQWGHGEAVTEEEHLPFWKLIDAHLHTPMYVVRSYGYQFKRDIRTQHGSFSCTYLYPESALGLSATEFMALAGALGDPSRFVLDMDTCGVEYTRSRYSPGTAERFRLISLRDIRHQRMFGFQRYDERVDPLTVSSCLDFPDDQRVIFYDNTEVRHRKFDFIRENGMAGVMVGEPQEDMFPEHASSLMRAAYDFFHSREEPQCRLSR